MSSASFPVTVEYYQQFDADSSLAVPGEGYGGWRNAQLRFSAAHTALIVMHAWSSGTPQRFPGWHRAVEYLPRAKRLATATLQPLLTEVRRSHFPVFHVVDGGAYFQHLPGYRHAVATAEEEPTLPSAEVDPILADLRSFRQHKVFPGSHNVDDVARGLAERDFMPGLAPVGDEGVAETSAQLFALCQERRINHLIYTGFAVNWCILLSPGGMSDMARRGLMCSVVRDAVTAVENKETAGREAAKQLALWRVALQFGFVIGADDLLVALEAHRGGM